MTTLLQDFLFGVRLARRNPGFTVVSVAVLALAIGGTAAMFTIINALLLRPIDAREPQRLVRFFGKEQKPEGSYRGFSYPNYRDIQATSDAFTDVAAFSEAMVGINEGDLTRRSFSVMVSANYFKTFGVPLAAGREFTAEEERPGSGIPVVIISDAFWQRTGRASDILGKTVHINARPFQVVGVARPYFTGTTVIVAPEFFLPLGMYEALANDFTNEKKRGLQQRDHHCLRLLGRLKPGVDIAAAQVRVESIAAQLAQEYPEANKDYTIQLGKPNRLSVNTYPQEDSGPGMLAVLLMSMSGAVLLIACLNLANMLLARGAARRREFAVRLSVGGTRSRLIRQLLTENLVLALAGGVAGLLLSIWANKLLMASLSAKVQFFTVAFDATPDWRVLLVTFGFCVVSVVLFGVVPAWRLSNVSMMSELKEQVGDEMRSKGRLGLFTGRNWLVVGQLALSLALLTAAGLFARGALMALRANPGFSFEQNLLVESDASLAGYDESRGKQAYTDVLENLRALPGVRSASLAYLIPFGLFSDGRVLTRASSAADSDDAKGEPKSIYASINIVATDYFGTLGIPLLRGRDFDRLETQPDRGAKVAIIDDTLARDLFREEEPVGKHIRFSNAEESLQIIGVVGAVKDDLNARQPQSHVYIPFGQEYRSGMNFHVRVAANNPQAEALMLQTIRQTIKKADPNLAIISVKTFQQFHEEGLILWFLKTAARLFGIFGGLALFLAVVGVYGVKSYLVSRRTREIGIRMALGADRREVLWMVLREGLALTAAGLALGLLLSLTVAFGLRSVVYGVKALDPIAFTLAPLCLGVAAIIACYLPARRATRVQPIAALRYE